MVMFTARILRTSFSRHPRAHRLTPVSRRPHSLDRTFKRNYQSISNQVQVYYEEYRWIPLLMGRLATAFGAIHLLSEYGAELTLCEGPSMLPTIFPYGEIILVDRLSPRIQGIETSGEVRLAEARKRQVEFEKHQPEDEIYKWHQPMVPVNKLPLGNIWRRFWSQLTSPVSVGDVVVVQHPDRQGTVCKRILGLPGDMVVQPPSTMRRRRKFRRSFQDNNLLVIPDGHIWIEGDNSMNSADSRNYGPIPAAMIVGRVVCRVWPLRGNAIMQRGARPLPPDGAPFSGSTILPAGYEGEDIIRDTEGTAAKKSQRNRQSM